MNKKVSALAIVIGFALLIAACSGAEDPSIATDKPAAVEVEESSETEPEDAVSEEDQESSEAESVSSSIDAAELYASNCAGCHGQDRSGGRGPALLPARLTGEATQYAKTITDGRGGMPSFSGKLSLEEITTLSEWILTAP